MLIYGRTPPFADPLSLDLRKKNGRVHELRPQQLERRQRRSQSEL
ncbi:hypothetical protein SETIT_6G014000v2 [Setaria italica]|uniref:Uncharacterized protein n=1 Tax=Setaria italica TaxID=4555 RepID=A0A368RH37_SETIT|nr:hypothetical protein SETIT_6G014000v2 [Setaria italica]